MCVWCRNASLAHLSSLIYEALWKETDPVNLPSFREPVESKGRRPRRASSRLLALKRSSLSTSIGVRTSPLSTASPHRAGYSEAEGAGR